MNHSSNFLLKTDSYKPTHYPQYPPKTTKIYSYLESRGGKFDSTLYYGLQYILKKHFEGIKVTKESINQASDFWKAHFGKDLMNRKGWEHILNKHGGELPLRIRAVPEGMLVPTSNVLMTIENTDDECYWLTNYAETLLMQIWYPITIATNSFYCKRIINKYLLETQGNNESLNFKLHDFGYRGVSCNEQAGVGGASHLVNFMGTDTVAGIILAMEYYGSGMCGFSIPASEHSTITSWGKENELEAYRNILKQYPNGLSACVIDSFDVYNAAEKHFGETLREEVMKRDGTLVLRPDSGNPLEVISKLLNILWNKFGGTFSPKGFKVLDKHVRIIQGDGIDIDMIAEILLMMKNNGFSAENIAFGSGGGLLQKFDRDTQKFAIKCSHAVIDGKGVNVYKDPITQTGKMSKKGMLKLHNTSKNDFTTLSSANLTAPEFNGYVDTLETVFENGELKREQTFDEIRKMADSYL